MAWKISEFRNRDSEVQRKKMLKLWTAIIFLCFYNCITLYGMEDEEMGDEDYADQEEAVAKGLVSS